MITQTQRQTLQQHPFVQGFPRDLVDQLAPLAREVRLKPDEIAFHEGDESDDFYLIVEGRVALEIVSGAEAMRLQTLGAGDEFGWSAVLKGRGKYFQARALEHIDTLAFHGNDLLATCERNPALGYMLMTRMLEVVSERLTAARLQLVDMYWPAAKRAGA